MNGKPNHWPKPTKPKVQPIDPNMGSDWYWLGKPTGGVKVRIKHDTLAPYGNTPVFLDPNCEECWELKGWIL